MRNSCESCKRYWSHLHGKVTRFVRRMNKNSRQNLVIPERFVTQFAGKIPRTIKLEGPNGNVYDVEVTEHRNRTILLSGWEVFVDANNIVEKDSLMFRYRGRSLFKVAVFDSGGCEKRVSCAGIKSTISDQEPVTNSTDMSSSSSDRNTHSWVGRRSDGCRSESSCHCRNRARTDATPFSSEDLSGEDSPYEHEPSDSDDHTLSKPPFVLSGQCYVTEEQEANIVALVEEVQPQMPLLVAMMKEPSAKPYPDLVIPKDYTVAYFPKKSQTITLQLARQSKTWHCKLHVTADGGRCNLYDGRFVRDNHLQDGDLCLFQPMVNGEGTTFTMMIHVLRKASANHSPVGSPVHVHVKEEQSDGEGSASECNPLESDDVRMPSEHDYVLPLRSYLAEAQKEKLVMLLRDIQPKTPVFVAIMKKSNVEPPYPSLHISKEYAVIHFPHESAPVTLQRPGGSKKWHPRFYKRNDASAHKIRGQLWFDFVCDNRVEEGDICILVPEKGGKRFTFTVYLLRAESEIHGCPFVPPYILPQMSCLSPLQQSIVEDKVQAIQLEAPLYVAIMNKTSVGVKGRCILEFGAKYADVYLPKREETILLQHKRKIWHTKLRIWIDERRRRVLDGGWRNFVRDNRLQVGDICLFELKKNRKQLKMIVHIILSYQC